MSFSFCVPVAAPPPFHRVIEAAALPWGTLLHSAGDAEQGWPKGLLQKVPDVTNRPSSLEISPQLAELFGKLGTSGGFLVYAPERSSRGVEVGRDAEGVVFRVTALASIVDYELAARLAAALARLADVRVQAEHGPDGRACEPFAPDELLRVFDGSFAERNAHEMSRTLLSQTVGGDVHYCFTPRGWVGLGAGMLAGAAEGERLDRARRYLLGQHDVASPLEAGPADPRRVAMVLARGMAYAAGADGRLDPNEIGQLEAQLLSVAELRGYELATLLAQAQRGGDDLAAFRREALELSPALRRKGFVLGAEVIASVRNGRLTGDPKDPNAKAVRDLAGVYDLQLETSLAEARGEDVTQTFLGQVVIALCAKHNDAGADVTDKMARAYVVAMLLAAAPKGALSAQDQVMLDAIARTVPELRVRDFKKLAKAARTRIASGLENVAADLQALPSYRNKCYAVVCDVALAAGAVTPTSLVMLGQLKEWIRPSDDYARAALTTFQAKHG